MQETGIVRRIDELGRVVIPKEIRKTLRIREGDPLEIYTDKEELILKKYSPVKSLENYAECMAKSIAEKTGGGVVITDTDNIIFVSGTRKKDMKGKRISTELLDVIKGRKSVTAANNGKKIPIYIGEDSPLCAIVSPIEEDGYCYGAIAIISEEKPVDPEVVKITSVCASFLAKQFS